jgi:uncharacterized protein
MPSLAPTFNGDRLMALERGRKLLVMDRLSGRSVYLPRQQGRLLRLAATPEKALPGKLIDLRREILRELASCGLGQQSPSPAAFKVLILKVTSACNYACAYCYDYQPGRAAILMSPRIACQAVDQALDLCRRGLRVVFHGGEPFLAFRLIRRIVVEAEAMAAERNKLILFSGQTNLSLLDDEIVRFSDDHAIAWGLSLDGPPAVHDTYRVLKGGGGTFERFEEALRQFPEFVRGCTVLATVTAANQDRLLEISRYFRDRGLKAWDWSLFQPAGRGRNAPRIGFDVAPLLRSWDELFAAVADGEFDGFGVFPVLRYLDNFLDGPGRSLCLRRPCGAARELLSISSDGRIEACDCIDDRGPLSDLGRFADATLAEVLNSPAARRIRSRDVCRGPCGGCIWLAVCGGTCLARAGRLHGVEASECRIALNAFDRISSHLADSTRLREYQERCYR